MILTLKQRVNEFRLRLTQEADTRGNTWVLDATQAGVPERVEEFWRYRRVFWFFFMRMLTRRYRGTSLGMFWLFARPLAPIAINTLIFGKVLGVQSDGIPYFLFQLIGMTVWHLFDRALMMAT